mmetsp:Transcript_70794/g.188992  ORF Transcript_70794/g.188992 Transcript_70794/m.188992 type:complete len:351 (+) Transcript_70794:529-1581(+)
MQRVVHDDQLRRDNHPAARVRDCHGPGKLQREGPAGQEGARCSRGEACGGAEENKSGERGPAVRRGDPRRDALHRADVHGLQHHLAADSGAGLQKVHRGWEKPLHHHDLCSCVRRVQDCTKDEAEDGRGAVSGHWGKDGDARLLLQGGRSGSDGLHGVGLSEHHVQQGSGDTVLRRQRRPRAHGASHCDGLRRPRRLRRRIQPVSGGARIPLGALFLRRAGWPPRHRAGQAGRRQHRCDYCRAGAHQRKPEVGDARGATGGKEETAPPDIQVPELRHRTQIARVCQSGSTGTAGQKRERDAPHRESGQVEEAWRQGGVPQERFDRCRQYHRWRQHHLHGRGASVQAVKGG